MCVDPFVVAIHTPKMTGKAVLALVYLCLGVSHGYFWSSEPEQLSPQSDVTAECLQHADSGRCAFLDCVEARFPCGPDGFTVYAGKHFCNIVDGIRANFTDLGKHWMRSASICLFETQKDIYQQSQATCEEIKDAATTAVSTCNTRTIDYQGRSISLCDFIETDGALYRSIFGFTELRMLLGMPFRVSNSLGPEATLIIGVSSGYKTVCIWDHDFISGGERVKAFGGLW